MKVTKEPWCFSKETGGDIPSGYCKVYPYYYVDNHQVRGKGYGELMKESEADAWALEKGYLVVVE